MADYYMNEAMFDLPEGGGFVDRTITYLEGTSPAGADVVLLVERQPFPAGKTLQEVATEHLSDARKRLHRFAVLGEREFWVGNILAVEFAVRWADKGGNPVYTRQAHVALDGAWLIFAGESRLADREFCDECVDHVLATLRTRDA